MTSHDKITAYVCQFYFADIIIQFSKWFWKSYVHLITEKSIYADVKMHQICYSLEKLQAKKVGFVL